MLDATFIKKDIPILEKYGKVTDVFYKRTKGFSFVIDWLKSFFLFLNLFRKATHVFVWFADYHAFLPVFLGKFFGVKSNVIIAGYDAAHIPEINYGAYTNPLRAFCTKYAVRNADHVLPVASNLGVKLEKLAGPLKDNLIEIPFGFDSKNWFCDTAKENTVITTSIFETERRIKIKGLDFFIEVAKAMPAYQFIIIGSTPKGEKLIERPKNLRLHGRMSSNELRTILSKSKIYAQFSISEGLPNAVIEAMLCECIPIGTDVGGIPDIIGDKGFVLEKRTIENAKKAIENAFISDGLGKAARQRVLKKYPANKREKMIGELMNQ